MTYLKGFCDFMFWVKVLVICGFHYLSEVVCPQKNTDRNNFSVVLVIGLLGMIFFLQFTQKILEILGKNQTLLTLMGKVLL